MKLSTRLAAGTLAIVLPVAAVAGCGTEKKRTIKAEMSAAGNNLQASKALSVTLRFNDRDGNLKKVMAKDDASFGAISGALLKGGVTYTVDPSGNQAIKDLKVKGQSEGDLRAALKSVNVALVIRDDKSALGELRLVAGTLYAHVDIAELNRLLKAAGQGSVDKDLDQMGQGDPKLRKGVADVRAGMWIKLPLLDYIERFKSLADSLGTTPGRPAPTASATPDFAGLGGRVYNAVRPYVKVTDASDNSSDRVLDVNVQVRPALKAALAVLKASAALPFSGALKDVDPAEIDKRVANGTAHGTITLSDGHLKQVALDLESIRTLAPRASTSTNLKGSSVVIDVDDSAGAVLVPSNVSSFDLGDLFRSLLSAGEQHL